jgi:hypothetical protein
MNHELEIKWTEVVVTWFKVLCLHLPEATEENHKNPKP